jgi:hypothetical protein
LVIKKIFEFTPEGPVNRCPALGGIKVGRGQNVEREYITEKSHSESWEFHKVVLTMTRIEQNFTSK